MRILDKYIFSNLIKVFLATVLIFCLLYVMIDITTNLDELIDRKVPILMLVKYYGYFLPIIFVQISSIAGLICALLTFSALNSTNEVIAMRSCGLNFWQITKPALIFGIILSVLVLWMGERLVPKAATITDKIKNEHLTSEKKMAWKKRDVIKNLTFYGLRNRLYFVSSYSTQDNELEGITIIEYDENQNIQQKIVALTGKWTGIAWKFYKCQVSTIDPQTKKGQIKFYDEKLMDIKETPKDFLRQRISVSTMNFKQLREYITRFASSGATRALNNLRVDLHEKIAYPFSNFIIILTGLPFSIIIRSRKRSTFAALGVAMIIGFLFYVLNAVCLAFGKGELIPPFLSAWTAPGLTALIALVVIQKNF